MKMASYNIIIYILVCFFYISSTIAKYHQNDTTCPSYTSQITWSSKGEIELIPNVQSVGECFKLCISNVECVGHTWYGNIEKYGVSNICVLFSDLQDEFPCNNCLSWKLQDSLDCCSEFGEECQFTSDNFLGDVNAESELECFRSQSFTTMMKVFRQDKHRVTSFRRCLSRTFP